MERKGRREKREGSFKGGLGGPIIVGAFLTS